MTEIELRKFTGIVCEVLGLDTPYNLSELCKAMREFEESHSLEVKKLKERLKELKQELYEALEIVSKYLNENEIQDLESSSERVPAEILPVGTRVKFRNGSIATVVKISNGVSYDYRLSFESHKCLMEMDFLLYRDWEVLS